MPRVRVNVPKFRNLDDLLKRKHPPFSATRNVVWLGQAIAARSEHLRTIHTMDKPASPSHQDQLEIERKYVLSRRPHIPAQYPMVRIEQAYLPIDDSIADADLMTGEPAAVGGRVRRKTAADGAIACMHTVKRGEGLVRQELERTITNTQFEAAWTHPAAYRLTKTRTTVDIDGCEWVVDVLDGIDLVLAEVELPAADAAAVPPAWLGPCIDREVTGDYRYTNRALAERITRNRPAS
jgi:adenylate cyclase